MQVIINSGHNIVVNEALDNYARGIVESTLSRMSDHITRVEVHLHDTNRPKGGADKRCLMEARIAGKKPLAVEAQAMDLYVAVTDASGKLERAVKHSIEREGH